ncbi:SNF2 family N-terminal domain-containing protein [Scenedesmus sp. NREL 46B-D3]|nr:SNF2 family N-terminal domain-containing protein [Scenedesmus sp. NREL 46B-D3]
MGDCIDLTLDSDEEAAPKTSRPAPVKRRQPSTTSDDSDVILVEDGAEAKRARQEPAEQQEPVDPDADVIVTAATGDCYCMVCDKSAAECQFWGTGVRARDHCNAHSTSYWEALRKAARKGNRALLESEFASSAPQLLTGWLNPGGASNSKRSSTAGMVSPAVLWARAANAAVASSEALLRTPAGSTPAAAARNSSGSAAAAGGLGSGVAPLATPAAAMKKEVTPQMPATRTPQVPAASSWLQRMPHPDSIRPHMQHLATLELPVKTAKGLTIADVQRRLVPTGFYKGVSRYVPAKRKDKPDFLRLLPLVPPSGLPAAPSMQRTWKLLVLAHDASARPQAVAVTGRQDSADLRMADAMLRKESRLTFFAFKVPKDLLPRQGQHTSSGYPVYTTPKARMALVWHEKTLPREDEEQQQQEEQQLRSEARAQQQRWRASLYDSDDSDDSSCGYGSDDEDEQWDACVRRMLAASSGLRSSPQGVRFGLPQLVVVPELHLQGGDAADKAVRKSVIAQLGLFCPAGQAPSDNAWPFELKRMSVKNHWQRSQETNMRWAHRSAAELSCQGNSPGIAMLYAYWGMHPIAPPPGFDLDAFSAEPLVADAADAQQLAGMPKVLQDWVDYEAEMKLLSALPGQVMTELKAACSASPTPADEREAMHSDKPAAVAVLSIAPARPSSSTAAGSSSSAAAGAGSAVASAADAAAAMRGKQRKQHSSSRLGMLRIEVYVFRVSGRGHRLVAADYNDWGAVLSGRQVRRGCHTGSCALRAVMDARLLQEPNGYPLLRELERLKQTDCRSISRLMEWVVTGEREPAQQPAGLNVPLHPYQLQSLAFMQEAEQLEGGWRQLLWRWLPPHPQRHAAGQQQQQQEQALSSVGERGKGMWWSPVLDRLSFAVPAAPWGGFLAEEMGLGKTVEVLGLVLSNPAPPSVVAGSVDASGKLVSRATLVVVAVSLVGQWCAEASSKLVRDPNRLATQFDLVVTTYATLASDYGKNGSGTRNPLHQIKWHRVVFDEGHTVKNIGACQSKACVAVAAERRWCCTGTPLNNDITDLLGQFAVLHMQPLGSKPFFDSRIKPAFLGYGYGGSLVPLLYTLRHSMVRHTKAQTIAGVSVLALPEKTEELVAGMSSNG